MEGWEPKPISLQVSTMPEEAFTIPKNLLIGLVGGVIVIGILLIIFGGIGGLTNAWCDLNPQFCGENITYFAADDIIAKNSVLALRCAVNSAANSEINDRTCPESTKTEYGVRLKLEGDYPETNAIRRCYGNSCAVCRLPEIKKSNEPTIVQVSLGGVYNSSDGLNWTNIGSWGELGDIKFLLQHKESLFAAGDADVFRLDTEGWKPVFSSSKHGISTNTPIQGFIEHNGSLYLAFNAEDSNGLYKSSDKGDTWTPLKTKTTTFDITNINNILSADDKLFLLSEGNPDNRPSGNVGEYEAGRLDSGLYRSVDEGLIWEFVEPRIYLRGGIDKSEMNIARRAEGSAGGYIDIKGDKTGEGVGDVKKIIKSGQNLFAASEIATEYYAETDFDNEPFTGFRVKVKSGGVYKSTDGGDNWTRLYYGNIKNLIEFNGILYVFDSDRGVIAFNGGGWDNVVIGKDEIGFSVYKFLEYNGSLFAASSRGIFKSAGTSWTKLVNNTAIGGINDVDVYKGALVVGSSEVSKIILSNTASISAADTGVVGGIGDWIKSKYRWLTGTDVPSPFVQAQPNLDYCKVENFHLPQKFEEVRDPVLGIDWNPETLVFGYGDPKYLAYWQSFPPGEDSSWRSFREWEKNVLFIAATSCFPFGKTLKAAKGATGKVLRKAGEKVGFGVVGKEAATETIGENVAGVVINSEGQILGKTATIGLPAGQLDNVFVYSAEKGVLRETKRQVIQDGLESEVGKKILQEAEKNAAKTNFKDLKTAARILGFGTPIAFMASLMESILTKYESFGNSIVFKYHSKEPFRPPEPLLLDIQPQKSTAYIDGKEKGNYKESLRPVILDKGSDASSIGRVQNWLSSYIKDTGYITLAKDTPVTLSPLYFAAPCHTDLQVGDTTAFCNRYIYNPTDKYAYCELITEDAAKAVDHCGVVMKNGVVQSQGNVNKSCAIPAIRVSSVSEGKYDDKNNFCYSKSSWKAEVAFAGTVVGSIVAAAYTGGAGACAVGLVGGLITEYYNPTWPGDKPWIWDTVKGWVSG